MQSKICTPQQAEAHINILLKTQLVRHFSDKTITFCIKKKNGLQVRYFSIWHVKFKEIKGEVRRGNEERGKKQDGER